MHNMTSDAEWIHIVRTSNPMTLRFQNPCCLDAVCVHVTLFTHKKKKRISALMGLRRDLRPTLNLDTSS